MSGSNKCIENIAILAFAAVVCWATKSAWGLIALIFINLPQKNKSKEESE